MNIEDILGIRTIDDFNALHDTYGGGHWKGVRHDGHEYDVYFLDAQLTVFAGSNRGFMKVYRGRGRRSGEVVFARSEVRKNRNGRMTEYTELYPTAKDAFNSIN